VEALAVALAAVALVAVVLAAVVLVAVALAAVALVAVALAAVVLVAVALVGTEVADTANRGRPRLEPLGQSASYQSKRGQPGQSARNADLELAA
jgi:fatty acid desaturase